jgi:hypothetical protein
MRFQQHLSAAIIICPLELPEITITAGKDFILIPLCMAFNNFD